jgi:hypothetical protein
MAEDHGRQAFPRDFDAEFPVGTEEGNHAFFGRDVLRGLIAGIDDFIHERQPRWKQWSRTLGPVLLGSAGWINDRELIDKIGELAGASIVVTKLPRGARQLNNLQRVNARTRGLPAEAFWELAEVAPKVDGEARVIGPYDNPRWEGIVPTIRTIGFRQREGQDIPRSPPLMHAKLALLGHLWWHDEGPEGHVDDVVGFTPHRLWISSANFTHGSRVHLEFGYWTEDKALLEGARQFLTTALRYSEGLDPASDVVDPDLVPVVMDDVAMQEVWAEYVEAMGGPEYLQAMEEGWDEDDHDF